MKRLLAIAAVALASLPVFGALAPIASAYIEHPYIGQHQAYVSTLRFLNEEYASWRYRTGGEIDCKGGRISSYEWSCRVNWQKGYGCVSGRTRVVNNYAENHSIWYTVGFNGRWCSVDY